MPVPIPATNAFLCENIILHYGFIEEDVEELFGLFERIAAANGWSFEQMATTLPAYLRAKAAEAWISLDYSVQDSYTQMNRAMTTILLTGPLSLECAQRLKNCSQELHKTVTAYSRRIQTLVR